MKFATLGAVLCAGVASAQLAAMAGGEANVSPGVSSNATATNTASATPTTNVTETYTPPAPGTGSGGCIVDKEEPKPVDLRGIKPRLANVTFYNRIYSTFTGPDGIDPGAPTTTLDAKNCFVGTQADRLPVGWEVAPFDNYTQLLIELFPFGSEYIITSEGVYDHKLNKKAASGVTVNALGQVDVTYCPGLVLLRTKRSDFDFGDFIKPAPPKISNSAIITVNGRDYATIDNAAASACNPFTADGTGFFDIPAGWDLALDNVYSRAVVAGSGDLAWEWGYSCKWLRNPDDLNNGKSYTQYPGVDCNAGISARVVTSKTLGKTVVGRIGRAAIMITRKHPAGVDPQFTWTMSYPAPAPSAQRKVTGGAYAVVDGSSPDERISSTVCNNKPVELPSGWVVATPQSPGWQELVTANKMWGAGKNAGMFEFVNGTTDDPKYVVKADYLPFVANQHCSYKVVIFRPSDASQQCNWEWTAWSCDADYKFMQRTVKGKTAACPAGLPDKVIEYCTLDKQAVQQTPNVIAPMPSKGSSVSAASFNVVVAAVVAVAVAMIK